MDYDAWITRKFSLGETPAQIASSALQEPIAITDRLPALYGLLNAVSEYLDLDVTKIHIVGSARFGFSLSDGAVFNPRFSDLDLALVDAHMYVRCKRDYASPSNGPRFPEIDLPAGENEEFRLKIDELSRSVREMFSYVSIAVYPNEEALVTTLAIKIFSYWGGRDERSLPINPNRIVSRFSAFAAAVDNGLPTFPGLVSGSNPSNSSPYLADMESFQNTFATTPERMNLFGSLRQAFEDLEGVIDVECCLVGGSFVDLGNPAPRDVDTIVFYRSLDPAPYEIGHALSRLSRKFVLRGVDARFVPCDGEVWLLVKMTSFFTSLYHADRGGNPTRRGLVLLLLDGDLDSSQCDAFI